MNSDNKAVKQRVIPLVISSLLPLAVITLGALQLIRGSIFTISFALIWLIFPLLLLLLTFIVNLSKIKTWIKIVLNIVLSIIFIFAFLTILTLGYFERLRCYDNSDIAKHYTDISDTMPTLSEIGNPRNCEYYDYFSIGYIFFDTYTDTLICEYDEADYITEKNKLEEKYVFQSEPMTADEYSCDPEITIDGYTFKALSIEEYDMFYPKEFTFVATNDETNEIVYMHFYDIELDYIESLEEFIYNDCGWKHIR